MTTSVTLDIAIGAEEYLRHYAGSARDVVARARDGRRVRFPATLLRQFVSRDGVYGTFRIDYTGGGKFLRIERIG